MNSYGPEAGARLCNAIRKMLERYEHVEQVFRNSTSSIPSHEFSAGRPVNYAVPEDFASRDEANKTEKKSEHLLVPHLTQHRKSKSIDAHMSSYHHSSLNPIRDSPIPFVATTNTGCGETESEASNDRVRPRARTALEQQIPEWSRMPLFQPKVQRPSDTPEFENTSHVLPEVLRSRAKQGNLGCKIVLATLDNLEYKAIDLTAATSTDQYRARILHSLGLASGRIYIARYVPYLANSFDH